MSLAETLEGIAEDLERKAEHQGGLHWIEARAAAAAVRAAAREAAALERPDIEVVQRPETVFVPDLAEAGTADSWEGA